MSKENLIEHDPFMVGESPVSIGEFAAMKDPAECRTGPTCDTELAAHVRRELTLAGHDQDTVHRYLRVIWVMEEALPDTPAKSAGVLCNLLRLKPLTAITNHPLEWEARGTTYDGQPYWQNIRNTNIFSHDGGETYYDLLEGASVGNPFPLRKSDSSGKLPDSSTLIQQRKKTQYMRQRFLALFGIFAILSVLGVTSAQASVSPDHLKSGPVTVSHLSVSPDGTVQPFITEKYDMAYGGQGGFLHIPSTIGANDYFSPVSSFVDYQLVGNGTYWVHPAGSTDICLTESTTQKGVIKSENCEFPAVDWQLWVNLKDTQDSSRYKLINSHYSNYLTDPSSGNGAYNATIGGNTSWGNVGSTMLQGS